MPLRATFANSGLTTPPGGVPCPGYLGLTADFRHRKIPVLMPLGAMSRFIIDSWVYPIAAFFDGSVSPWQLSISRSVTPQRLSDC